tara:strand:- start:12350 stop:12766 length:417 start_codon:yes stop_codon:yes gene_type:complete
MDYPIIISILFNNDLINYIYSLIHYQISPSLLEDITSFHITNEKLKWYYNKILEINPTKSEKYINIIIGVLTNNLDLRKILYRHYSIQKENDINRFLIHILNNKNVYSTLHNIIALMNKNERYFLVYYINYVHTNNGL